MASGVVRGRAVIGAVLAAGVWCGTARTGGAQPAADGWPAFQNGGGHTARATVVGPVSANRQWSIAIEGEPGNPAVGPSGIVYLPTGLPDTDTAGYLYAIEPDADGLDATILWRADLAGLPASTTPAIAADGTVYVHVNGSATTAEALQAFHPNAVEAWTFEFDTGLGTTNAFVQSSPVIGSDGTIYVGSQDGYLYAIEPDGDQAWRQSPTAFSIASSPAIGPTGNVYVHDDGGLFAYSSAGLALWHLSISGNGGLGSPSVGADGTVYFAHLGSESAYAVTSLGALKWSRPLGTQPVATPAIAADGTVYFGANGLYAVVDAVTSGTPLWRFSNASFSTASPIVSADGTIFWRAGENLYGVTPGGLQRWTDAIPFSGLPGLDATPALAADGTLYVAVSDPLTEGQALIAYRNCPATCDDGNPCTVDACNTNLGCTHTAVENASACDDATVCNGRETCHGGVCTAGTALNCVDGNACTSDICNAAAGCQNPNLPNATSCADANLCNGAESCQNGTCTAGTSLGCDDANACTTDACIPATGCTHTPETNCRPCAVAGDCGDGNACTADQCVAGRCQNPTLANGTSCADANLCDGAESCQAGSCQPGTPLNCNDGNPCKADRCDPATGCAHDNVTDGTTCTDSTLCNGTELCQAGACQPGTPLNCVDGNPCTTDTCEAATGCKNATVSNGVSCADGNACNGNETCAGGACTPGAALDCDDHNPCSTDTCDTLLGCRHDDVPNQPPVSCDDGNVCNGQESCSNGVCTAGAAAQCDDGRPCTDDTCNAISGCAHVTRPGCNDCDSLDDCDDANPCTQDLCANGHCSNPAVSENSTCSDGSQCNGIEVCHAGACTAGTALGCDDGNPCTIDSCDAVLGCVNMPAVDDTPCADGTLCNGAETCHNGTCTAGAALDCDDLNGCTADDCDAEFGCIHAGLGDGTSCADATVCNGGEICQAGACTAGTALGCDDGDACTADACNAISGCSHGPIAGCRACTVNANCNDANPCTVDTCADSVCQNAPVANNTSCSDGNLCNGTERCTDGACVAGTAFVCNDQNGCTRDFCDPFAGCQHGALPGGSSCSDGNPCNGDETCTAGICGAGANPPTCQDGDRCTIDSCDPSVGCKHITAGDGSSCTDGDACDGQETCASGVCTGAAKLDCDDHNPCTDDSCDPDDGCGHARLQDGSPCGDGNHCNGDEFCAQGTCAAGTVPDCDDHEACTADGCVTAIGCTHDPRVNGTSCADGDVCDGAETCTDGACTAGGALSCDDDDACTADTCDAAGGCEHTAVTGFAAVTCSLASGLDLAACEGQRVPKGIVKRFARARALIQSAESAGKATARHRALVRAVRLLARAIKQAKHAGGGKPLDAACSGALMQRLSDVRGRAAAQIGG